MPSALAAIPSWRSASNVARLNSESSSRKSTPLWASTTSPIRLGCAPPISPAGASSTNSVTGSVNQQGDVQPIGGVNQKIEGFYDVCKLKGFTGAQGVLIPAENVEDLMLRDEVIDAVAKKKFHIYPVATIGQGIEILTGVRAGKLREVGEAAREIADRFEGTSQKLESLHRSIVAPRIAELMGAW